LRDCDVGVMPKRIEDHSATYLESLG